MSIKTRLFSGIILLLAMVVLSCQQEEKDMNTGQSSDMTRGYQTSFLVNSRGDSILTGVPNRIEGRYIRVEPKLISHRYTTEHSKGQIILAPERNSVTPPIRMVAPRFDTMPYMKPETVTSIRSSATSQSIKYPVPTVAKEAETVTGARTDIRFWGIDQNMVTSSYWTMIQDRRGDLWLGSLGNGVIRFNGERFEHFSEIEGLGHQSVYAICEDSKGNIWFGTAGGGVIRFDGQSTTRYTTEKGLPHNIVLSIMEDDEGIMWFGTRGGLCRYEDDEFTHYTTKEGLAFDEVISIYEDSKNHLWVGTGEGSGLHLFDGERFVHFNVGEGMGANDVHAILEDRNGNMWFGTWGGGVIKYDGKSFEKYTTGQGLPGDNVLSILEDQDGALWFGIMGGGVTKYDGRSFINYTMDDGLSSNDVRYLLRDDKNNIWACTWNNGVNRINPRGFLQIDRSEHGRIGEVSSVIQSKKGYKWLNTAAGLLKLDENHLTLLSNEESIFNQGVGAILEDSKSNLWLGTQGGVSVLNESGMRDYTRENGLIIGNVRKIIEDKKGHIWLGTYAGGILRYDGTGFTQFMEKDGFARDDIITLFEDGEGHLWIGTQGGGVARYDGQNFTLFTTHEGLSNNVVVSILEDHSGNMWFGTQEGVTKYDGTTFKQYRVADGLIHNKVFTMTLHHDNIFISTQRGISVYNPDKDQFYNLDKAVTNFVIDEQDQLWAGSLDGVVVFDLTQLEKPSENQLQVQLTDIQINNESIDYRNTFASDNEPKNVSETNGQIFLTEVSSFYNLPLGLRIPYEFNHLTFFASAIGWNVPDEMKYSFYLEGVDKEWSAPQAEARMDYRNLPYGRFTLNIRATNHSGIWSDPFTYTFKITPPWYHTWLAYALYALMIATSLYFIYRLLLTRKIAIAEGQRLKEIDDLKSNIYTNITHEFRTPLTVINGMASELEQSSEESTVYRSGMIKRNSQKLLSMVNQMLKLSKLKAKKEELQLHQGDIILFLKYLVASYHSLAQAKNISLQFHSEEEALLMDFDADKVETILANLISNAIKYTGKDGRIEVLVNQILSDGITFLEISVKDDGIGINKEDLPFVFDRFHRVSTRQDIQGTGIGLAIVKELVALMKGTIKVESIPGKGSEFILHIPIERNALYTDTTPQENGARAQVSSDLMDEEENSATKDDKLPVLLIIEDNVDILAYLNHCLRGQYTILTSRNGDQGIEEAIQSIPDIIISDVMMPGKDGYEVCKVLKEDDRTNHIPIILLTAKVTADDKLKGLVSGADAYLTKPFEKEELLIRLEKLLLIRKTLQQKYLEELKERFGPGNNNGGQGNHFLSQVENNIMEHLSDGEFSVNELAGIMHLSRSQLNRKIRAATGMSTSQYIRHLRLLEAQRLLLNSNLSVTEIVYKVGFNSPAYFTKVYKNLFGYIPTAERATAHKEDK